MNLLRIILVSVVVCLFVSPALATTYYVDSVGGNDANTGTDPGQAWQSLVNVNGTTFSAGDQILLKFPALSAGQEKRNLPVVGFQTRISKNAYRLLLNEHGDWHKRLLSVLSTIIDLCHQNS